MSGRAIADWCLHKSHPDPAIEAKAREIYLARYGEDGGDWRAVETPEPWWALASEEMMK